MKSTSSFTTLPDFGLYCSSKNFFMMRVGGQSGTAILSVTSSAREGPAPPIIREAAKPAATIALLIVVVVVVVVVIFSSPPMCYQRFRLFLFRPPVSDDRLSVRG